MSETEREAEGKRSALRRFPNRARIIEDLTRQSEDFRDMCEELAEAEAALLAAKNAPAGVRGERMAEWTGWIERLSAEISAAVDNANVIPLDRARRTNERQKEGGAP
jgi:hypothetical protein